MYSKSYRKSFRYDFFAEAIWEFRRIDKRLCYAWAYNNFKATQVWKDFMSMYEMGGEL